FQLAFGQLDLLLGRADLLGASRQRLQRVADVLFDLPARVIETQLALGFTAPGRFDPAIGRAPVKYRNVQPDADAVRGQREFVQLRATAAVIGENISRWVQLGLRGLALVTEPFGFLLRYGDFNAILRRSPQRDFQNGRWLRVKFQRVSQLRPAVERQT